MIICIGDTMSSVIISIRKNTTVKGMESKADMEEAEEEISTRMIIKWSSEAEKVPITKRKRTPACKMTSTIGVSISIFNSLQ